MCVTGGECKKRWKSIRDHYRREKKEEKGSTGSAAKKKRAIYWERLQFLDAVEDERESFTNVSPAPINQQPTLTAEGDTSNPEVIDESASNQQTNEDPHEPESQGPDAAPFRVPKSKKRKENSCLNQFLKEKKEDRELFKKCIDELVKPPQEIDDEHDLFFKSVAATVKKFRPDLVTRTKAKIFDIVTEMELLNQTPPIPNSSGFSNIVYSGNRTLYSSSAASSSWTTPDNSEASSASDIVSKAFMQAFEDEGNL